MNGRANAVLKSEHGIADNDARLRGRAAGSPQTKAATLGLFTLLLSFGVLLGCQRPRGAADLVIINGGEPESLDPAIVTVQSDLRLVRGLFEGVMRLNPRNEIVCKSSPGIDP